MKTIALMVPDFFIEHCQDFIKGVSNYLSGKEARVIIAQTKFNTTHECLFDYQYWTSAEILKSKQIDAYIFISGVYTSIIPEEDFVKILGQYNNRPIISASLYLDLDNCYSVINNCKKTYQGLVKHLKEKHECKKIAFMSANSTNSQEALERFESFKEALELNELPFYPELVFEGRFTDFTAKEEILKRYKSKDEIDFDSIISANDIMASGMLEAFELLDIRCPEDVKMIGFDDAVFATLSSPKLSTVNQSIANQGIRCASLAYSLLMGEHPEKKNYMDLETIFRQSCGCIKMTNIKPVHKNIQGRIVNEKGTKKELLSLYLDEVLEKRKYTSLIDSINDSNTLKQFFFNIKNVLNVMHLRSMCVCLYKEPVYFTFNKEYKIPNQAEVVIYTDKYTEEYKFKPNVTFDPNEEVFPFSQFNEIPDKYILYPIFSGEANYGYLVCIPMKENFSAYTVNFMILISAISQAVEYTQSISQAEQLLTENNQLIERSTHFEEQSKTDELTKILNRRGFLELGQRLIDVIQEINVPGVVFFADMDGLKTINDTYGHEMGDKAIRLQAEVLRRAFRSSDVVGRLSGDEFGIVANGMTIDTIEEMRKKINRLNKEVSEENNLPFTLSISFGATDLEPSSVLSKLLSEADKLLYKEKKSKKIGRH